MISFNQSPSLMIVTMKLGEMVQEEMARDLEICWSSMELVGKVQLSMNSNLVGMVQEHEQIQIQRSLRTTYNHTN